MERRLRMTNYQKRKQCPRELSRLAGLFCGCPSSTAMFSKDQSIETFSGCLYPSPTHPKNQRRSPAARCSFSTSPGTAQTRLMGRTRGVYHTNESLLLNRVGRLRPPMLMKPNGASCTSLTRQIRFNSITLPSTISATQKNIRPSQ
ncbi:hypothetical protein L917_20173 [Phytophthora nicotianae]|uniref:Uncharacterized protein n=1 Tax=Phytophthora nicotianae TaxID=4792 RepID=W2HXF6_PHYNI|nr:hypothetical protein L915_20438 [Phytophthora nicotianae]ETL25912.1 hypothetical protein L916_20300 [Phytophthora nicotianae]ETL79120.1 hypothetical protein L917_20173 [Phytophthora nicotianae]